MTARQLLEALSAQPLVLAGALAIAPLLALFLGLMHTRGSGNEAPWKYLYSLLVYAACVPGMGAAVLTAYSLFFTHENLLDRDLLVYLLPIVAMGLTLAAIGARADFRRLPGFDRLSGLMVLIGVTFVIVLAVSRTRIGLLFGGSLWMIGLFIGDTRAMGLMTAFILTALVVTFTAMAVPGQCRS